MLTVNNNVCMVHIIFIYVLIVVNYCKHLEDRDIIRHCRKILLQEAKQSEKVEDVVLYMLYCLLNNTYTWIVRMERLTTSTGVSGNEMGE